MANRKHPRLESAEERTEKRKPEWLQQCFFAVETVITVADQEMAAAKAAAAKA
jgi:hypothetical protein